MLKKMYPSFKQPLLLQCKLAGISIFSPGASGDDVITQFGHYENWCQSLYLYCS